MWWQAIYLTKLLALTKNIKDYHLILFSFEDIPIFQSLLHSNWVCGSIWSTPLMRIGVPQISFIKFSVFSFFMSWYCSFLLAINLLFQRSKIPIVQYIYLKGNEFSVALKFKDPPVIK